MKISHCKMPPSFRIKPSSPYTARRTSTDQFQMRECSDNRQAMKYRPRLLEYLRKTRSKVLTRTAITETITTGIAKTRFQKTKVFRRACGQGWLRTLAIITTDSSRRRQSSYLRKLSCSSVTYPALATYTLAAKLLIHCG